MAKNTEKREKLDTHSVGPGIWKKKKKTLTNEEFEEQTW
jgi:hypothetical protein